MNNTKKIIITTLTLGALLYAAFLIKKSFFDKGYYSDEDEKEVLLGYYVISLGQPNTKANRDKYKSMSLENLRKELGITDVAPE